MSVCVYVCVHARVCVCLSLCEGTTPYPAGTDRAVHLSSPVGDTQDTLCL